MAGESREGYLRASASTTFPARPSLYIDSPQHVVPSIWMAMRAVCLGSVLRTLRWMRAEQRKSMHLILRASHVLQISKRIVQRIAIDVIAFQPSRWRAEERISDKMMHEPTDARTASIAHSQVALRVNSRCYDLAMSPHIPEVAYLNECGKAGCWQPNLSGRISVHRSLPSGVRRRVVSATSPHNYFTRGCNGW